MLFSPSCIIRTRSFTTYGCRIELCGCVQWCVKRSNSLTRRRSLVVAFCGVVQSGTVSEKNRLFVCVWCTNQTVSLVRPSAWSRRRHQGGSAGFVLFCRAHTLTRTHSHLHIRIIAVLLCFAAQNMKTYYSLAAGEHVWPFSIQLPAELPPTVHHPTGNARIVYEVRASMSNPGDRDGKAFVPFTLVSMPVNRVPRAVEAQSEKAFGLQRKEPMLISAKLQRDVYAAGELVRLKLFVDNASRRTVARVRIDLVRRWRYDKEREVTVVSSQVVAPAGVFPLAPRAIFQSVVGVQLPRDLAQVSCRAGINCCTVLCGTLTLFAERCWSRVGVHLRADADVRDGRHCDGQSDNRRAICDCGRTGVGAEQRRQREQPQSERAWRGGGCAPAAV